MMSTNLMSTASLSRIIELLSASAAANGAGPAIIGAGREPISYDELVQQVERTVKLLVASGVKPNDRIAVVGSSGPDMAALVLAIMSTATCAPLNPMYTAAELEFYLNDIMPRLLIVEGGPTPAREVAEKIGIPTLQVLADGRKAGAFTFAELRGKGGSIQFAEADDIALLLHTSGTTARPKMVPITQRNLCSSAFNIAQSLLLSSGDRCLSVMPLFHIHGLVGAVLATIASGGSLACPGLFRPPAFFGWLKEFQPTWYTATPSMHSAVLERSRQIGGPFSHHLRFLRSCSAPLPSRTVEGLERFFGVPLVEAYGMTEAAHQIACNPLPPAERKRGSVGIPTGTTIGVMDSEGALLPPECEGELVIRGANVMSSYIAAAEINRQAFNNGWFRTGDLGRIDNDGYLFITGRIKEIINRGGEKISPREIDEVLLAHPAVAEAVSFGIPDARLGEDVGAAIVLKPSNSGVSAKSLISFAETKLAHYKLPRRIVFVNEIPKGPTGKPQRIGLAKHLGLDNEVSLNLQDPPMQPRTPTEEALLELSNEVFKFEKLGVNDNLFDRGADSLSSLTLLLEIERRWHVTVTIADLFSAPTVAEFSKVIEQTAESKQISRMAVIQSGTSKPALFCLGAGPMYRQLAALLGPDQPFLGPVLPRQSDLPSRPRIEDVANYFVKIIRSVQLHGPYFLGGWCIDGLVAYEVAQQLSEIGEVVSLLVLFDTSFNSSWAIMMYGRLRACVINFAWHVAGVINGWRWRKIPGYLRRRLRILGVALQRRISEQPYAHANKPGGWGNMEIRRAAAESYRPSPYAGRVLLLKRSMYQSRWTHARQDWSRLVRGRYEAFSIAGNHEAMFKMPNVDFAAQKLRAALSESQRNVSRTEPMLHSK
jgi:oxalate---CoA ligase